MDTFMLSNDTLNILIVEKSHDEANRFISILRSADFNVDAKLATNEEELQKYISMRNWDLLLAALGYTTVPVQNIFQRIRRAERDVSVILISQQYSEKNLIEGLRLGAVDVVIEDQGQHLIQVVQRTLASVHDRRQCREWERKLSVAEKRAHHLMEISRFPIAIIKEGAYAYANEACANIFGFSDPDEMLCLPIIDNIAPKDREKLKAYMVPLEANNDIVPFEAAAQILDINNRQIESFLQIHQIQYEGEPALQLTINKDKLFEAHMAPSEAQAHTEYSAIQPHLVYELISRGINRSAQNGQDGMLLNIQIDKFDQLKEDLGIAKAEKITHSVVMFAAKLFDYNVDCGRISENCFIVVLAESDAEKVLALSEKMSQQISDEVFDIDNQTFSLTTSIGITVLNENVPSVERTLERSEEAINELRTDGERGNGAKFYVPDIHSDDISKSEAVIITAKNFLSNGSFSIHYQPIVPLMDDSHGKEYYEIILGIGSDVPTSEIPNDFINNLFKSEIAAEVDRWIIGHALTALAEKLKSHTETQLFVNISAQSFTDEAFMPWLQETLKASHLSPSALIFQFREIDAVRHLNQAASICRQMKQANFKVGISNFGIAINPAKTIEMIAADFIKIDRMIVEKLEKGPEGKTDFQKLMGAMTGTGVNTIVPFVERASIIPTLWQQGVQYIQGHYIKKPSPDMDFDFSEGT